MSLGPIQNRQKLRVMKSGQPQVIHGSGNGRHQLASTLSFLRDVRVSDLLILELTSSMKALTINVQQIDSISS